MTTMTDQATAALSLSTAALVAAVYTAALPPLSVVRGAADTGGHLAASERYAAILAGSIVLGVAGALRSPQAAAVGLVVTIGYAAAYSIARRVTP